MKKAIISGSTGNVGKALVQLLHNKGIQVLCLGSKSLTEVETTKPFGIDAKYLQTPMSGIRSLCTQIERLGWDPGDSCVFFNFAWRGESALTDGTFETQLKNSIYSAHAVEAASQIGCSKFINAGTLEETFMEDWLKCTNTPPPTRQANYALCKLISRDMSTIASYLRKIDYIHTRLSVPLNFNLSGSSYIPTTLRKIIAGETYNTPLSSNYFDIISTDDVATAYMLIGLHGKNMANYYVGASRPATLSYHFAFINEVLTKNYRVNFAELSSSIDGADHFDTSKLSNDTGFAPSTSFAELAHSFIKL